MIVVPLLWEGKFKKDLKVWDKNPKEDNLEDGVLYLEKLEDAIIHDYDDRVEMTSPSSSIVPMFKSSTLAT